MERLSLVLLHKSICICGPSSDYRSIFSGFGSLEFNEDGTISPFVQIRNKKILPHIAMYMADDIKFKDDSLLIDNEKVRTDRYGNMVVNFRPAMDYYKSSSVRSMQWALKRARNHEAEKHVKEGDTVVVSFNFYTGNTDFVEGGPLVRFQEVFSLLQ